MVVGDGAMTMAGGHEPDLEARRHAARQQREIERHKKLGPGRLRSIGADIAGLRNQLEDKAREQAAGIEAQRREDDEDAAIRRYLLQVESEDALAKRREMLTLRNDWALQMATTATQREIDAQERMLGVEPDLCAPGAAQKFAGEDPDRLERERLQKLQRQQWSREQHAERVARDADEAQHTREYMMYLFEVERLQQLLHEASERDRAAIAAELQRFNLLLREAKTAGDARWSMSEQEKNAAEIAYTLSSNLVSENPRQAALPGVPLGQRVRVDHWKGLNREETRCVLAENDAINADRAARLAQERQEAADDAQRAADLHRTLLAQDAESQSRRAQQELEVRQTRERQAAENAARERANAVQARGQIETGFFKRFGQSYR